MTLRWAYLGPEGTFAEQAARDLAGRAGGADLQPCAGVPAAIAALRAGAVTAAVVPLENSVEGSVPLTQDELIHGEPLVMLAEAVVAVTFDLLVRPGTELDAVRTVASHPHAHAQVRDWLTDRLPGVRTVETSSTAAAAAAVSAGQFDAAVAAPSAGALYGLVSVVSDIGVRRDAVTRFVRLELPTAPPPPSGNDRSSMILSVRHEPGSLLAVLTEFAVRGINLTRLESRPTREVVGEYVFIVDADGHIVDRAMADTVAALIRRGELRRFLGSYPKATGVSVPVPFFGTDTAYGAAAAGVAGLQQGGS